MRSTTAGSKKRKASDAAEAGARKSLRCEFPSCGHRLFTSRGLTNHQKIHTEDDWRAWGQTGAQYEEGQPLLDAEGTDERWHFANDHDMILSPLGHGVAELWQERNTEDAETGAIAVEDSETVAADVEEVEEEKGGDEVVLASNLENSQLDEADSESSFRIITNYQATVHVGAITEEHAGLSGNDLYAPFSGKEEYILANLKQLSDPPLTQRVMDQILSIIHDNSFDISKVKAKTSKQLTRKLDRLVIEEKVAKWETVEIRAGKPGEWWAKPETLRFTDPLEVVTHLFGRNDVHVQLVPVHEVECMNEREYRVYTEAWSGNRWEEMQVRSRSQFCMGS